MIDDAQNHEREVCTAKPAVCSEIRTKQSTQSQHHVELLNIKPGGT
jgi:hypothetical protein